MNAFTPRRAPQRGTTAVEFAMVAVVFFLFLFGMIEMSRALYLWSTMTTVTNRAARAAAITSPTDAAAKDLLRQRAMFVTSAGQEMILGGGIKPGNLTIDYLQGDASTVIATPPCPADNVVNCLNDPNGATCVRFVRVRLCLAGTSCSRVPYTPMVALPGLDALRISMPYFTAVAPIEPLAIPGACT
jgi:Flp pilus assembly protein TadG